VRRQLRLHFPLVHFGYIYIYGVMFSI
jgi:hypothetical protein